jgi:LacI family transcriptional regulator
MANVKQIAKKCGVSVATISRVINHPESVLPETRERIIAIMNELNYVPNEQARSLTLNRTNTIALLIPNILNPLYPQIAKGVEDISHQKGYNLLLCNTEQNVLKEQNYIDMLIKRKVDGLILTSSLLNKEYIEKIRLHKIPLVFIGQNIDNVSANMVFTDYELGAYQAITHFLEIGYKRIAFITAPINQLESIEKQKGYEKALKEYSIPIDNRYIIEGDNEVEGGYFAAKKLLLLNPVPEAIFACNDLMAIGAIDAIKNEGMKIPQDIAIIGFDDIKMASLVEPKLTTVSQPVYKMGLISARLLFDSIENKEEEGYYQKIYLEPKLKIRKSCGHYDRVREIFS